MGFPSDSTRAQSPHFEGYEAFHYLARAIVESSGSPPRDERRVLLSAARSWGIRPAAAVAILSSAADADAADLPPPSDPGRREEILHQAATVAMADGHLVKAERLYLSRLARGLGFGVDEVRDALGRAKREFEFARPQGDQGGAKELELVPLAGDLVEGELELSDEGPRALLTYACRSPSGAKTLVKLYAPEHGFELTSPSQTRRVRYDEVTAVSLGLRADETCVCGVHLRTGSALHVTNSSATHGSNDYDYLAFVRKFHTLLKRAQVRAEYHVTRPGGGRQGLWLRAGAVTIPIAVILYFLVDWTLSFGDPFLPGALTFLVGVVGCVAAGSLIVQALSSGDEDYTPPDFPASVLPGAEDLTVLEALGKGGTAALWVIALVMSSDD